MVDWDALLAYDTVKFVTVRDRRLGIIMYVFYLAIFCYVVIYKVVFQTGYLRLSNPEGTVRLSLQPPTVDSNGKRGCDPTEGPPGCNLDIPPLDQLPYCLQNASKYKGMSNSNCTIWDAMDAVVGSSGQSQLFVTSRVTESEQVQACTEKESKCPATYTSNSTQKPLYIAGIERFTLMISHSVRSDGESTIGDDSSRLNKDKANGAIKTCKGTSIKPQLTSIKEAYFTIDELLHAAASSFECSAEESIGLDLDNRTSASSTSASGPSSYRYDGMVLVVRIVYSNYREWSGVYTGKSSIRYHFEVRYIDGTKAKQYQIIYGADTMTRKLRNRHGIQIIVTQEGHFGVFDWTMMMVQLTVSLSYLAAVSVIVDYILLYFLPQRRYYHASKYSKTKDLKTLLDEPALVQRCSTPLADHSPDSSAAGRPSEQCGLHEPLVQTGLN